MTQLISLEFLVAVLFIIDAFLVILLFLFVKRVNQLTLFANDIAIYGKRDDEIDSQKNTRGVEFASESARDIIDMLEPLVKESRKVALSFDEQIKEKRKLSRDLNDALDSRIISINLLLSRAAAFQKKLEDQQESIQQSAPLLEPFHSTSRAINVMDQQNLIIDLYYQKTDVDTIAEKLSIPKGEVQLVIDLKEKFIAMEQSQ
jgi:hypothetical protein